MLQVFFLSKGIGTFRIGIIQASMVLVESFTQPFWGWFAGALPLAPHVLTLNRDIRLTLLLEPCSRHDCM